MSTHDDTSSTTSSSATEPGQDSTVTDWHGQDVERDMAAAEEALDRADGNEARAEAVFETLRPQHEGDRFDVPADEREGTLSEPPRRDAAAGPSR